MPEKLLAEIGSFMLKNENIKGAAFMCVSMAAFSLNDAAIKFASTDIGIFQSIFIRGAFATALIFFVLIYTGGHKYKLSKSDVKLIGWRNVAEVGSTIAFLTGLSLMPIANITAILQALPLTVTLGAVLFMGETVGWRRSIAILVGLFGVLLIIQPGTDGFTIYSLWGVLAVFFVTWRDLIVRNFSAKLPTMIVAFLTALCVTLAGLILTVTYEGWSPVSGFELSILAIASFFIFIGYYFAVATMRHGDISFVTPFRYTIMIWAILLGYFIWDDVPNGLTILGLTIVIGMGLYTLWREKTVTD